jgi:hypothetical protein
MDAVGILAVVLGTCAFLFRAVGKAEKARPALPMEMSMSAKLNKYVSALSDS